MAGCAIDLDRLSSAYGTTRVCDEISLRIRRGAKVVLVGSNGAGKTALVLAKPAPVSWIKHLLPSVHVRFATSLSRPDRSPSGPFTVMFPT